MSDRGSHTVTDRQWRFWSSFAGERVAWDPSRVSVSMVVPVDATSELRKEAERRLRKALIERMSCTVPLTLQPWIEIDCGIEAL